MQSNLFKKSSMERISSPEKLNDYIQVSNPASWMVLGAALALVIGMLAWGFFGRLNESVSFNGQSIAGTLECYVPGDMGDALRVGMEVSVLPMSSSADAEPMTGVIRAVAEQPVSYDEASRSVTSDYMLSSLGITGWNIAVSIEVSEPLYEGVVYSVSAVTDTFRPIELVFH